MNKESIVELLINWLTNNPGSVAQVLYATTPILALLLAGLVIYGVFWKGPPK